MVSFNGVGFCVVSWSSSSPDVEFSHGFFEHLSDKGWAIVGVDYGRKAVVRDVGVDEVLDGCFGSLIPDWPGLEPSGVAVDDGEDGGMSLTGSVERTDEVNSDFLSWGSNQVVCVGVMLRFMLARSLATETTGSMVPASGDQVRKEESGLDGRCEGVWSCVMSVV